MKVKISDFIAKYLVERGIVYNFTVPGGGAMHLNVSLGHQKGMNNVFVQHEQAAAMAAEAFYRISNTLPVVCCTTGPGGTNTLTGVLGAWLDSIPMLVLSGQVKYSTTVRSTGETMRIFGDQEFDITKAVSPMTKYAEMVTQPELVKYHLDKAIFLAVNGRPGPVWLDIPLNVQSAYIDEEDFVRFDEGEMMNMIPQKASDRIISFIIEKIKTAKYPVFYSGVGIRTSGAYDEFRNVIRKLNIPVVTSFDGIDLMADDDPLYAGRAGDVGNRYGNWAVQNSDLLLVVGSRLGIRQVGYAAETWARNAFVIMVYEDSLELLKSNVHVEFPVRAETRSFLKELAENIKEPLVKKEEWFAICKNWKEKYPVVSKERHYKPDTLTNPYCFMNEFSLRVPKGTDIVSANGSACVVGANAFVIKDNQRFVLNSGAASMGYELPAAIGACFANGKKEVVCLAGDGSIQMNIQELQTIVFHKLPVKIVIINNAGYHSMRLTQNNLFKDFTKVGVGPESSDLSFPDMEKIAKAYEIPYCRIDSNEGIEKHIEEYLEIKGCAICEVFVDTEQVFEPKPSAMRMEDGTLVSPPMEDMAPFLPREELRELMLIPLVEE